MASDWLMTSACIVDRIVLDRVAFLTGIFGVIQPQGRLTWSTCFYTQRRFGRPRPSNSGEPYQVELLNRTTSIFTEPGQPSIPRLLKHNTDKTANSLSNGKYKRMKDIQSTQYSRSQKKKEGVQGDEASHRETKNSDANRYEGMKGRTGHRSRTECRQVR